MKKSFCEASHSNLILDPGSAYPVRARGGEAPSSVIVVCRSRIQDQVAVAVAVAGLTKRFLNHIQKDFLINVFWNFTQNEKHENHENKCAQMKVWNVGKVNALSPYKWCLGTLSGFGKVNAPLCSHVGPSMLCQVSFHSIPKRCCWNGSAGPITGETILSRAEVTWPFPSPHRRKKKPPEGTHCYHSRL